MSVQLQGIHIQGSPFALTVYPVAAHAPNCSAVGAAAVHALQSIRGAVDAASAQGRESCAWLKLRSATALFLSATQGRVSCASLEAQNDGPAPVW